jgi:hypothetical protein
MKTKLTFCILAFVFAATIVLPAARADEYDQASMLTFNQSVQIPGRVLPAGTYWFVLADSLGNRNIVQVFNSDRSIRYATILAITSDRPEATDNTAITFAERGAMQPDTMVSWFYPGRSSGHQFVYSNKERQELAQDKRYTIMAGARDKYQTVTAGN